MATYGYQYLFRPTVLSNITEHLTATAEQNQPLLDKAIAAISQLPASLVRFFGLDSIDVAEKLSNYTESTIDSAALYLTDTVVGTVIIMVLKIILFFVIFSLLSFVLIRLSEMLRGLQDVPVIGAFNRILGGIMA